LTADDRAASAAGALHCPHRPPCPGCPRFGEPGPPPAALARLAALADRAGAPPPAVETGASLGHRHRARLMVRGRAGSPKIGLFQEGSHRIVDVPRCAVHHPRLNEVAGAVRRAIRATGVAPYADRPHAGLVRAIQGVVERASRRVQLVLVANDDAPDSTADLADAVRAEAGDRLHSLWWNGNPERTNVILGPHWSHLDGPTTVRETIGGVGVHYPPAAFGQNHLELADRLAARVAAWVPDGARVCELHAGCGALGLGLLSRVERWSANEVSPAGLEGLAAGLAERPEAERARARLLPGRAAEHLDALDAADVVVVDPPRRGLESEVLARLAERPPERLIAVSCALDAFEREAHALLEHGRMGLAELRVFDLFPFTAHVEILARFDRRT
jgi:tRNA/tmRNA/rRNA uracil-C5-methylase (TrmA/RlmC/RlmD family)